MCSLSLLFVVVLVVSVVPVVAVVDRRYHLCSPVKKYIQFFLVDVNAIPLCSKQCVYVDLCIF